MSTFAELGLSEKSLQSLTRAGFEHPTPIQARAIPPALEGKDVIGTAATGTGKTAAFLLPIIERLAGKPGTRALVLAPTRELALQIGEELERFGKARHVRGAVVIGGVGMGQQERAFREKIEVIIATPGRLVDHLQQGTVQARPHRGAGARRGRPDARHGLQAAAHQDPAEAPQGSGRRCSSPPPPPARWPSSPRRT